jgi:two-component system, LytTR family, response regulator
MLINLDTKSQIDSSQILFLKSHINYTEFMFLNQRNMIFSYTLHKYESILQNHNFKRVHRSYLVNMEHVVANEVDQLILSNGLRVPMSRRKRI